MSAQILKIFVIVVARISKHSSIAKLKQTIHLFTAGRIEMKFEVNYAKEFTILGETEDKWFWTFVEADNEEQAAKKIYEEKNAKYILSMTPVDEKQ